MKDNKAPGQDGYTASFYQTFLEHLQPTMKKVFNNCADKVSISQSMSEANIIVIPKEGKDHLSAKNYRPISLINVDSKIYAKILATRLNPLLSKLISNSQVSFLKTRFSSDNTRPLCHILEHTTKITEPAVAITLDAEKAFDRVSWTFLEQCMRSFNLGEGFIKKQ